MKTLIALIVTAMAGLACAADLPNILWCTSEDHGPHMGCYGDPYADTPNIDQLAARGMRYLFAWSNAPVCAPARTTLISGIFPPASGAEHMRSMTHLPAGFQMYPALLQKAGYYCTNTAKEDYNLKKPEGTWDESSGKAHWKNRKPGQPFFAVFNSEKSHESKIRNKPHELIHDPAKARIPAYHPDTPEVRHDWAQYYDGVTAADADAGNRIKEVEAAGLAQDTIIFYYADHGSGMPRNKRWPYNSGLRVPLVVYIPPKFKHLAPPEYKPGGTCDRLVSFVDFAPTLLSLAGIKPPAYMQGYAFMGQYVTQPQSFLYGFRGRMDERYDCVRSVTDGRYVYLRQYMPNLIYGQYINYMFQTPTTQVWRKMFDQGKLNEAQSAFWKTKPSEELYDLTTDPDEVRNLAASAKPEHQAALAKLRQAHRDWAMRVRDVGLLPEGEIHSRSVGSSPYEVGHDDAKYPFARVFDAADKASMRKPEDTAAMIKAMSDSDSAVRYWGAMGLWMRGKAGVDAGRAELHKGLADASPYVRIISARALGEFGDAADLKLLRPVLMELAPWKENVFVSLAAMNAISALKQKMALTPAELAALPSKGPVPDGRYSSYIPRVLEDLGKKVDADDTATQDARPKKKADKKANKKAKK